MFSRSPTRTIWRKDLQSPGLSRMETMQKKKMQKAEITQECWIDSWRAREIANHNKNMDGTKQSVQKWTDWHKKSLLTSWRGPSICDIHQFGVFNLTNQDVLLRWPLDLIIAQQSHWKITCTEIRKIIKNQSHHKIKTEFEKAINSQKHTVEEVESTRKLGGDSGHLHLLLQAGGKVINSTGKMFDQVSEDLILIFFDFVAGSDFVYR